jgi:hypothetical protein
MSEPFLERLSRFTPDAGNLQRDALLFTVGRASARPNRGWITLAAVLAGTQALSVVVLLWPHATPPGAGTPGPVAAAPKPAPAGRPAPRLPSADRGLWSAGHSLRASEPKDQPDTGTFVDSGPPLRAFGPPPPSILH